MEQMIACIAEIKLWMANNYLKLNEDKTEFIIFGTPHDLKSVSHRTVSVGDEEVFDKVRLNTLLLLRHALIYSLLHSLLIQTLFTLSYYTPH